MVNLKKDLSGINSKFFATEPLKVISEILVHDLDVINHCYDTGSIKPIHFAVQNNNIPAIEMLLLSGANPYDKTACGHTAIDLAKLINNQKTVDFLSNYMVY